MKDYESKIVVAAIGAGLVVAWVFDVVAAPLLPERQRSWAASLIVVSTVSFILKFARPSRHKHDRVLVLDTSAAIDGRIADVIDGGWVVGRIVVPQFVVAELQNLADSGDKQRRTRGRRGLDVLNRLRESRRLRVEVDDRELREYAGKAVDDRLIALARDLGGRLLTTDFNLQQAAQLQGVDVVNLNDLAKVLRPPCVPGEKLVVEIQRAGEQPRQGVGYLDDGTMVVVEEAAEHVGRQVSLVITGVTQSSSGRMVFGRSQGPVDA